MKIKSQKGDKYEVEFEKIVKTTKIFEIDTVTERIAELEKDIAALVAEKNQQEEILALMKK